MDSVLMENLAEEPGGAVFSQRGRRSSARSSPATSPGTTAERSTPAAAASRSTTPIFSNNLVDGSGGAIGTTGDILVVRSHVDGNTTDGDGGALYTDEDGDVTVIDSTVDGNTADGPGGAIYTLEGDVTDRELDVEQQSGQRSRGRRSPARPTSWSSARRSPGMPRSPMSVVASGPAATCS